MLVSALPPSILPDLRPKERMLVLEYCANGHLGQRLFSKEDPLPWNVRALTRNLHRPYILVTQHPLSISA